MCEQSSCKCTPPKAKVPDFDYSSIDYQLDILTAAQEGKKLEVATKRAGIPAGNHWVERTSTAPFNFKANHYRIKREPRKAVIWSHPNQPYLFLEPAECSDQRKRDWTSRGWSPSTYVEVLDA